MEWDDRYNSVEWDCAYRRTESYLGALQIRNKLLASRLVNWVLEQTAERCREDPALSPEVEASRVVDQMVDRWFERSLKNVSIGHELPPAQVRLALLSSDDPVEWQRFFLQDSELSASLLSRLQQRLINAGPEFQLTSMQPRSVEFGRINQMAETALVSLDRRPGLRLALVWVFAVFFFGGLFFLTR
jgi:hypothetical protein